MDTLKDVSEMFDAPIEYAGFVEVQTAEGNAIRISEDYIPGLFYGGYYVGDDEQPSESFVKFPLYQVAEFVAIYRTR